MCQKPATTPTKAHMERLHHDHADRDQRAIAQIVLPEPFLF
jgi:hypothetical protein